MSVFVLMMLYAVPWLIGGLILAVRRSREQWTYDCHEPMWYLANVLFLLSTMMLQAMPIPPWWERWESPRREWYAIVMFATTSILLIGGFMVCLLLENRIRFLSDASPSPTWRQLGDEPLDVWVKQEKNRWRHQRMMLIWARNLLPAARPLILPLSHLLAVALSPLIGVPLTAMQLTP